MVEDYQLRECLCNVVNINLSDEQWTQASLPVRKGGLGIRQVSQLAPSAFLASTHSTSELQNEILKSCQITPDHSLEKAVSIWSLNHSCTPPADEAAAIQRNWDSPVVDACYSKLLNEQTNAINRARFLAVSARKSSDWLHAF